MTDSQNVSGLRVPAQYHPYRVENFSEAGAFVLEEINNSICHRVSANRAY